MASRRSVFRRSGSLLVGSAWGMSLSLCGATALAAEDAPKSYPACVKEPTEAEETAAKGAFDAGQVSFQEADYDRTILYWEDAFRRDCTAVPLLLNLARAYELSGKKRSAVNALETYLERRPEAADRAAIEKRIGALRSQIESDTPKPVAPEEPKPKAEEPAPKPEAAEPEAKSSGKPIWPIFLTGGGVVVLGVGIPIAIAGNSDLESYYATSPLFTDPDGVGPGVPLCNRDSGSCSSAAATQAVNDDETRKKAMDTRNLGVALAVVGGAAAIGGAIVWTILWTRDDGSDGSAKLGGTSLTPIVTPGYQGLSWSGSF